MSKTKKPATSSIKTGGSKKKKHSGEHAQPQMKIVPSETCERCNNRCARGIAYLEKMNQPGAIGMGVPCPLTLH